MLLVKLLLDDIKNQVIGIDEVWSRCFLWASSILFDSFRKKILNNNLVFEIKDSKKLSNKKRIILSRFIKEYSSYSIGIANNIEIDEMNIPRATNLSMIRSRINLKKLKI